MVGRSLSCILPVSLRAQIRKTFLKYKVLFLEFGQALGLVPPYREVDLCSIGFSLYFAQKYLLIRYPTSRNRFVCPYWVNRSIVCQFLWVVLSTSSPAILFSDDSLKWSLDALGSFRNEIRNSVEAFVSSTLRLIDQADYMQRYVLLAKIAKGTDNVLEADAKSTQHQPFHVVQRY